MFCNIFGQGHRGWSARQHDSTPPCHCPSTFTTLFTPTVSSSGMPICRCMASFSTSTLLYHLLYHCKLYVQGDMPRCHLKPYIYINRQYLMHLGTNADKDLWIIICRYADVPDTVTSHMYTDIIFQVAHNDTTTILYLFLLQEITLFHPKMANGRRIG